MDGTCQVALIGQPNVGKSNLFARITGVGVISSNYAGTTVEFKEASVIKNGITVHIHDLPGTYSLSTNSPDERVVVDMLSDDSNDIVVIVADATDLEGSLVLCFEVIELGFPVIVALNKIDAARKNFDIDAEKLSDMLGVTVIPVSAKTGEGIDVLVDTITRGGAKVSDMRVKYDSHIIDCVEKLGIMLGPGKRYDWGKRIKLLEGLNAFTDDIPDDARIGIEEMNEEFFRHHGEPINVHIARDRYGEAHVLTQNAMKPTERKMSRGERLSDMTVAPLTGIPILVGVIVLIFSCIIFLGSYLAELVEYAYDVVIGTAIVDFGISLGNEVLEAVFRGIDQSFRAILGLIIPYIMVFYIILGFLEDSGYLPRAVVLLDRSLNKLGLHGGGFIPMMVGLGCNVPAIMATRTIKSKRERMILITMIVMAVPCSAQIAIIFGTTGAFAGLFYSLLIFFVLMLLGISIGLLLNKIMKYEPSNLAIELPDFAIPKLSNVMYKMWTRTKDFFMIAVPLLIIGSIVIEVLLQYNALNVIVEPLSFITVGMLGLPAIVIIAFLVGILRKEMAYGMLVILAASEGFASLADFMTPEQFVVFGVVMAIYMPCAATIVAMWKEVGAKETVAISLASIFIAVLVGTAFKLVLTAV
ncbi:MAG: ferrous iron transport protein B [Candidatus Methanomethylophilaceae archaeon]